MFGLIPWQDAIVRGLLLALVAFGWVILLTRIVGLRTFSKMTAFDFIVTLATASLLAAAAGATDWVGFLQPMVAIGALLAVQVALARGRKNSPRFRRGLENDPVMLMRDGAFIEDALDRTRVSRADVMAKLRGANALDLARVRAVVLETTGDISVLHGDAVDDAIIAGIDIPGRDEATRSRPTG